MIRNRSRCKFKAWLVLSSVLFQFFWDYFQIIFRCQHRMEVLTPQHTNCGSRHHPLTTLYWPFSQRFKIWILIESPTDRITNLPDLASITISRDLGLSKLREKERDNPSFYLSKSSHLIPCLASHKSQDWDSRYIVTRSVLPYLHPRLSWFSRGEDQYLKRISKHKLDFSQD